MDPVTAGPMINVKRKGPVPVDGPRQTADIESPSYLSANTNPSGYCNKAVKPTRSDEVNSELARKWPFSTCCTAHAQHSASVLEAANCDCQSRCIGGLHDSKRGELHEHSGGYRIAHRCIQSCRMRDARWSVSVGYLRFAFIRTLKLVASALSNHQTLNLALK